jgi:hypothetical protein
MKRDELAKALGKKPIKRASGNFISTETSVPGEQTEKSALSQNRTSTLGDKSLHDQASPV